MPHDYDAPIDIRDMRNGSWFWSSKQILVAKISPAIKLTYFGLCSFSNKNGNCYPSFNKLAEIAGISRRSVITAINYLTKAKAIRVVKEHGKANRYDLLKVTSAKFAPVQNTARKWCKKRHIGSATIAPITRTYNKNNNNRGLESLKTLMEEKGIWTPKPNLTN